MNFGSLGVTAAVLLPGCMWPLAGCRRRLPARLAGDSELGTVARCGQSEFEAAALLKAVWWNLRPASLLTHSSF